MRATRGWRLGGRCPPREGLHVLCAWRSRGEGTERTSWGGASTEGRIFSSARWGLIWAFMWPNSPPPFIFIRANRMTHRVCSTSHAWPCWRMSGSVEDRNAEQATARRRTGPDAAAARGTRATAIAYTMPVRRTGVAIRVAVGGGPVVMPRHARASCVNPVQPQVQVRSNLFSCRGSGRENVQERGGAFEPFGVL